MDDTDKRYRGGCLCGALRFEASGDPLYAGNCYCADCRRASGSGFMPFMGFASTAIRFSGETRQFRSKSARGTDSVRNFCSVCGSLVFGGDPGTDESHTVYAGSLDNPSLFHPQIAIFTKGRPAWAVVPEGLVVFEGLPK